MNRLKVHFDNGYSVSMIEGEFSYGFEVAVVDKDGNLEEPEGWVNGDRLVEILCLTQQRR